ncbi:Uncharacterized protein conserved in bacteria [Escherichia coli]|nr:Uncharacterized protein conserved in bacteria [Escherichia coli]
MEPEQLSFLNQQIMCFFYDGWSKSGLSSKGTKEIEDDELAAYKKMANAFLAFSNKQIKDLIETGFLIEVKNER